VSTSNIKSQQNKKRNQHKIYRW